jgi:hypothetical protein
MKVMVIGKASKASEAGEMPPIEMFEAMDKFTNELINAGILLVGAGLTPTSQGARVRFSGPKRTVTNGPFAETTELIAGFMIWKVSSLQEAIDWVKKSPNCMIDDYDVEIRPFIEPEEVPGEFTPELISRLE